MVWATLCELVRAGRANVVPGGSCGISELSSLIVATVDIWGGVATEVAMGGVIGEVLPLAVGVAISPLPIITVVLMLLAPHAGGASAGLLAGWRSAPYEPPHARFGFCCRA